MDSDNVSDLVLQLRARGAATGNKKWREAADRITSLEAEVERLKSAIIAVHPQGMDPSADPFKILDTLAKEWLEMTMAGPPQIVEFVDEDGNSGKLEWCEGDDTVGIGSGYDLVEYPRAETAEAALAKVRAERDGMAGVIAHLCVLYEVNTGKTIAPEVIDQLPALATRIRAVVDAADELHSESWAKMDHIEDAMFWDEQFVEKFKNLISAVTALTDGEDG